MKRKTMFVVIQIISWMLLNSCSNAASYEDRRCSCVCPGLDASGNKSNGGRSFYQDNNISPEECNCNDMVLPRIVNKFNGSQQTYCIQCDCRYETRNTTFVLIVVVSLLAVIAMLILYMACLYLLQKLVKQRRATLNHRQGHEEQFLTLLNGGFPDTSEEDAF